MRNISRDRRTELGSKLEQTRTELQKKNISRKAMRRKHKKTTANDKSFFHKDFHLHHLTPFCVVDTAHCLQNVLIKWLTMPGSTLNHNDSGCEKNTNKISQLCQTQCKKKLTMALMMATQNFHGDNEVLNGVSCRKWQRFSSENENKEREKISPSIYFR